MVGDNGWVVDRPIHYTFRITVMHFPLAFPSALLYTYCIMVLR